MNTFPLVEWPELAVARLTYPSLSVEDQGGVGAWLMRETVKFDPRQSQGHFTFRTVSNRFGKSILDHLANGRTHGLLAVREPKFIDEREAPLRFLFLVDLRRAWLCQHLAEPHTNRADDTPFLLYDVMTAGVEKFCERLRTNA